MDSTVKLLSGEAWVYIKGKWKNRYCLILRTPIFTTYVRLYIFKDQDEYHKRSAAEVNFENPDEKIFGLTCGHHVDKKSFVIAFTCEESLLLVALNSFPVMQKWVDSIHSTLEDANYRVTLSKTSGGSKLPCPVPSGILHIQKSRICFFGETVENPKVFFIWKVATIPDFAIDKDTEAFVITADSSCGKGKGKHHFISSDFEKIYNDMFAVCRANPMPSVQEKRRLLAAGTNGLSPSSMTSLPVDHVDSVAYQNHSVQANGFIKNNPYGPHRSDEIDIPNKMSSLRRGRPHTHDVMVPTSNYVWNSNGGAAQNTSYSDLSVFGALENGDEETSSVFEADVNSRASPNLPCNITRDSTGCDYVDMVTRTSVRHNSTSDGYTDMHSPPLVGLSNTLPKSKKLSLPANNEKHLATGFGGLFRRSTSMNMRSSADGKKENIITRILRSFSQNDIDKDPAQQTSMVVGSQESEGDYCEVASTHSPASSGDRGLQAIPEHCQQFPSQGLEAPLTRPGYVRSTSAYSSTSDDGFTTIKHTRKPRTANEYVSRERIPSTNSDGNPNGSGSPAASPPDASGRHCYMNLQPGQHPPSEAPQQVKLRQRTSYSSSTASTSLRNASTNSQVFRQYENMQTLKCPTFSYRADAEEISNPHLNYMDMANHLSNSAPSGSNPTKPLYYAQIDHILHSNELVSSRPPIHVSPNPVSQPAAVAVNAGESANVLYTDLDFPRMNGIQELMLSDRRYPPHRSGSNLSSSSRSFRGKFKIGGRKVESGGVKS